MPYNPHKGRYDGWELTKLGKVVCRQLSMNLFAQVQEPLIYGKLSDLEERVRLAIDILCTRSHRLRQRERDRIKNSQIHLLQRNRIPGS
jgi:hypothetical protein